MPRSMKMHRWIIAATLVALVVGVGLWRTHAGGGPNAFLAGPLRVVGAQADTTSGPIAKQQALAIITAKLAELEPNVTWDTAYEPSWSVTNVTNMTQVYDAVDGHVLYTRTLPIDAVVAELRQGDSWVFGIIADSAYTSLNCHGNGCDPPGTLLDAQAFISP